MQKNRNNALNLAKLALSSCLLVGLAACSSDDSDSDSSAILGTPYAGAITPTEDYEIPELRSDGSGGYVLAPAVDGNFPAIPAAKVLRSGETFGMDEALQPALLENGDLVNIRWKMYGLRSGELVEDSDDVYDGSAVNIVLGGGSGGEVDVPRAVHEALKGQRVGDRVQVVFEYGMPELPDYFESDDAYTLVVEVVDKS